MDVPNEQLKKRSPEQGKKAHLAAGRDGHGRDSIGRFRPGVSGNPAGRPVGSRSRASLVVEGLLDGRAEALAEKAIEMALDGHPLALRLCLERLLPVQKERQMVVQLPALSTAPQITAGFTGVVEALTHGELTPSETNSLAALLENARRALETTELAKRVEDLENRLSKPSRSDHGTQEKS